MIHAQLAAGYESDSGFRDAFSKIMGTAPGRHNQAVLKAAWIDTPLGPMIAIADDESLYLLEFVDRRGLEREVERMRKKIKIGIIPGNTTIINSIRKELADYFSGILQTFKTPLTISMGTDFQKTVWTSLLEIPYGETTSYGDIAKSLGNPKAYRAVAKANGTNQLAIIIPCHRVISANGDLAGYAGGIARKKWLIEHEAQSKK